MRILKKLLDRLVYGKPYAWTGTSDMHSRLQPGETPVPGKIYRGPAPIFVGGWQPCPGQPSSPVPTGGSGIQRPILYESSKILAMAQAIFELASHVEDFDGLSIQCLATMDHANQIISESKKGIRS